MSGFVANWTDVGESKDFVCIYHPVTQLDSDDLELFFDYFVKQTIRSVPDSDHLEQKAARLKGLKLKIGV